MILGCALVVALLLAASACTDRTGRGATARSSPSRASGLPTPGASGSAGGRPQPSLKAVTSWVYQLQGYAHDQLGALIQAPQHLAVIDLARDANSDYFTANEIAALRRSGKIVLAYFEIGSIEDFRPEYPPIRDHANDLILNRWPDWPNEYFVRYWDPRWWDQVIRPRVDQALRAGFDGVYLDTPLAYEELDLKLVPGQTRDSLARAMVALIVRISQYAKSRRPGMLIFPQNSPELRQYPGYTNAIDGIGMEELFFQATDAPCTQDWCAENLNNTRALRAAGKTVLAVDYATRPGNIRAACARYQQEGFAGYVTTRDLDRISAPCG